ncbi:hypothetical protein [Gordonia rhizosphera]|uniref:Uncharacterized protein n=1 Tax=Gordonia rhizosphera NBRC 16068 TaxID=1108045 RepID=K6V6U8_9ACTN|nr:hypothetical protein [Gordonia rhizosphera]GAB91958.1 hypothetical protein GORHZ_154_00470 [Gordonia rhizosphera NBRC 16068]
MSADASARLDAPLLRVVELEAPEPRDDDPPRAPDVERAADFGVFELRVPRVPDFVVPAVARAGALRAPLLRAPVVAFEAMRTD